MKRSIFICACLLLSNLGYATPSTLAVRGEATVYKPADQIELVFDVLTENKDPQLAVEENNAIMKKTLANLQEVGLTKEDYYSSNYQLQPVYRYVGQYQNEQILDHYAVHHTLSVKTQRLDLADAIIGAAIDGGVNQIQSLSFTTASSKAYRDEAVEQAAQNGLTTAKILANAAGVRIIKVLSLSIDQAQAFFPQTFNQLSLGKRDGFSPHLQAGPVELRAEVNMVFEIEP